MSAHEIHAHWFVSDDQEGDLGATDALFPFWSFTKTVISACALKLVERGCLELDACVSGEPFTLRQLLAHTSGLPDYGQFKAYHDAVAAGEPAWPRERVLEMGLRKGLLFDPGAGWSYSNIGYLLVRQMIEDTTGLPLGDAIARLVTDPLGLSGIDLPETTDEFSRLHWDAARRYDPRWVYHGCLVGTPRDACRLLRALLQGRVLSVASLDQMLDKHPLGGPLPGRPWSVCGYGLGVMMGEMDGLGPAVGHSGAGPFSVNAVYHFPGLPDPVTVACFTNGDDEGVAEFAAGRLARGT